MGCASSKRVEAAVAAGDVYCPPPTSIALFDISAIEEPWLIATKEKEDDSHRDAKKKPTDAAAAAAAGILPLPLPLLIEKLDSYDLAPASWSEVSKALEELKPVLQNASKQSINTPKLLPAAAAPAVTKPPSSKTAASITFDDFDRQMKKTPPAELAGFRAVNENSFVVRDRQERESRRAGDAAAVMKWRKRDPFEGYPEKAPPGNAEGVVLYTTTLRGVRRTFEDCERARQVVEAYAAEAGIGVDERDVSLHGEYLKELRELAGEEGAAVPRAFVRGRYVGGVEEVVELGESGRMREMMRWIAARSEKSGGGGGGMRGGCEGCGGARFVPCLDCSGSRKVVAEDGEGVERCGRCNENGLILCPLCH